MGVGLGIGEGGGGITGVGEGEGKTGAAGAIAQIFPVTKISPAKSNKSFFI